MPTPSPRAVRRICSAHPPTSLAIVAGAFRDGAPEVARERALLLLIADNRAHRIADNAPAKDHSLYWWLALDEIDREIPRGPREALLARALPDGAQREASLKALAAGREVAARFCREWNEVQSEADSRKYADLRGEMEKAGTPPSRTWRRSSPGRCRPRSR